MGGSPSAVSFAIRQNQCRAKAIPKKPFVEKVSKEATAIPKKPSFMKIVSREVNACISK
jgi:hypothetical protein